MPKQPSHPESFLTDHGPDVEIRKLLALVANAENPFPALLDHPHYDRESTAVQRRVTRRLGELSEQYAEHLAWVAEQNASEQAS